jgi:hypothetical protein
MRAFRASSNSAYRYPKWPSFRVTATPECCSATRIYSRWGWRKSSAESRGQALRNPTLEFLRSWYSQIQAGGADLCLYPPPYPQWNRSSFGAAMLHHVGGGHPTDVFLTYESLRSMATSSVADRDTCAMERECPTTYAVWRKPPNGVFSSGSLASYVPMMALPKKLYKFRSFNVRTLRLITESATFYADPAEFNDPMDCNPTIDVDVKLADLARLYVAMDGERGEQAAKRSLSAFIQQADQDGLAPRSPERQRFLAGRIGIEIQHMLRRKFATCGVLSFARTWNSPLMWSHYADQHRGVCLEFSTSGMPHPELKEADYACGRAVRASDLRDWIIGGSRVAEERVRHIYFYAKAPHWRYESEWRDVRPKVEIGSAYGLSGVYFGQRCDDAARIAVVKMLSDHRKMNLYDIHLKENGFGLRRAEVDRGEIEDLGVRPPSEVMMHQFVNEIDDLGLDVSSEAELTDLAESPPAMHG